MAAQIHYDRAPIAEVVIDLRIEAPAGNSVPSLKGLAASLAERFPGNSEIEAWEMGFAREKGTAPKFHSARETIGFRLATANGDRVLQVQRAGFTYSHLPPYTHFEPFKAEASDLWSQYVEALKPAKVTRTAVRVINRLLLPGRPINLRDYFNLQPNIPEGISNVAENFFVQLHLSMDKVYLGAQCLLNFKGGTEVREEQSEVILDIDLFVPKDFDPADAEIWSLLSTLSAAKNQVFEACITEETRKVIR
jgi:uncharacterized protein (TIGR04255 family)